MPCAALICPPRPASCSTRRCARPEGWDDLCSWFDGVQDSISWREAFPEFKGNEVGTLLSGYRHREGLTQVQFSEATGIPQRHVSEMGSGKRIIGKETAKKLGAALHCDYRVLL